MPTLYDQLKEMGTQLDQELTDDPTTKGDSNEDSKPVDERTGETGEREGAGEPGDAGDEGTPRDEGDASPEDARASQGDSGRAQKDAPAPQEDGEDVLKQPSNADWARQRREMRELKAKLAALEKEKAPPPASPEPKTEAKPETSAKPAPEPNKQENYQAWLEWKLAQNDNTAQEQRTLISQLKKIIDDRQQADRQQQIINQAFDEFNNYEESYKTKNPDYVNATQFAREQYAKSIKILYPQMTAKQIERAIEHEILKFAGGCVQKGLDPAEELYDMAIERFGYVKQDAPDAAEETPKPAKPAKPNLKAISANKKRSASPLAGGGQGGSIPVTSEMFENMTLGDYARLTKDQLMQLEAS